jgi:hypothetical protein
MAHLVGSTCRRSRVLASKRSKNKEVQMGVGDKAEDLAGKVKEGLGDATDNREWRRRAKQSSPTPTMSGPVRTSLTRSGKSRSTSRSTTSDNSAYRGTYLRTGP